VIRGLRALLLLFVKNIRSERAWVHQELKHNLLYRWFVRLQQGETLSDAFRVRLVRLRQRLARRLGEEAWRAFLSQTVELARRHYPPQPAAVDTVPRPSASPQVVAPALPIQATAAQPAAALPSSRTLDLGRVVFDLTPAQARARVLRPRDDPGPRQRRPISAGDPDAYWIVKERPHGPEATLGYEVGFFSQAEAGLISGVVVRAAGQDNQLQFNDWVDTYQQAWQVPEGQLEVSADREFWTGPILRRSEAHQQTLWVPSLDQKPPRGKLDQRYFTYFAAEDLWVCHEGAALPRIG
jgi:hypothetical protein